MNKHALSLLATVIFLNACTSKSALTTTVPDTKAEGNSKPGRIVVPEDSPKLQHIQVESVSVQTIPIDEVVAPGKIDVNPNRVARVTIPVAGRIANTLVRI